MPESSAAAADMRTEHRSNLFVVAALHGHGATAPAVRIRNLSPHGALIEGQQLPDVGTSVRLCRGQASAAAEVMWRDQSHAGLRFAAPVCVADWLPASGRNAGQQKVDRIVFEARAAGVATGVVPIAPSAPDYAAIVAALIKAGEELVGDPAIAERHPDALQAIDIAAQALTMLTRGQ